MTMAMAMAMATNEKIARHVFHVPRFFFAGLARPWLAQSSLDQPRLASPDLAGSRHAMPNPSFIRIFLRRNSRILDRERNGDDE
jgi:hypothetical protein